MYARLLSWAPMPRKTASNCCRRFGQVAHRRAQSNVMPISTRRAISRSITSRGNGRPDAHPHHAAGLLTRVADGDLVSEQAEVVCRGEASGAGAHDEH